MDVPEESIFHRAVRQEIEQGIWDTELWGRVLPKARGDEDVAVGLYIQARATALRTSASSGPDYERTLVLLRNGLRDFDRSGFSFRRASRILCFIVGWSFAVVGLFGCALLPYSYRIGLCLVVLGVCIGIPCIVVAVRLRPESRHDGGRDA